MRFDSGFEGLSQVKNMS